MNNGLRQIYCNTVISNDLHSIKLQETHFFFFSRGGVLSSASFSNLYELSPRVCKHSISSAPDISFKNPDVNQREIVFQKKFSIRGQ